MGLFIFGLFVAGSSMLASVIAMSMAKALDKVIDMFMNVTTCYQDTEASERYCSECKSLTHQPVKTNCEHIFCYDCIRQLTNCPECKTILLQFTGFNWTEKNDWLSKQHVKLWKIVRYFLSCWEPTNLTGLVVRMVSGLLMIPILFVSLLSLAYVIEKAVKIIVSLQPTLNENREDIIDLMKILRMIFFAIIIISMSVFLQIKVTSLIAQPRLFPAPVNSLA